MDIKNESTDDSDISMRKTSNRVRYEAILSHATIKEKISSGEFLLMKNRDNRRSKVWNTFAFIIKENGEKLPGLVVCQSCSALYKFNRNSTSNLVKHKCYVIKQLKPQSSIITPSADAENDNQKQSITLLTQWVIQNCRPFSIIEDTGFQEFAKFLLNTGAKFGTNANVENLIPHPVTIQKNIENEYAEYFKIVKDEVLNVKNRGFGLTSDIWTDDYLRATYLSLTIHYIKEGLLVTSLLGIKSMRGESCTGQNIKSKICSLLNEFDLDFNEYVIIVTHRSRNMIAAFKSYQHIFCINHLLRNAIEESIKENEQISDLFDTCTVLVKFLKKSDSELSLKSSISTTRNTFYYLLDSIEKNWTKVTNILLENNELERIENINLTSIKALAKIFGSFEEASKKLEGQTYATLHLSIVYIHRLKKICDSSLDDDSDLVTKFKITLSNFLDSIVLENLDMVHKIALFLFPPAKKLISFGEVERNEIKNQVKREMEAYADQENQRNEVDEEEEQKPELCEDVKMNILLSDESALFQDFVPQIHKNRSENSIFTELQFYENTEVAFGEDFNVLQWWDLHKVQFPLLYKLSCKILSVPASCSASERTFAAARQIISERKNVIGADSVLVDKIMFLHSNINKIDTSI